LNSSSNFQLRNYVATGGEFAARGGILCFSKSTLSVDLRTSRRWRCDLAALNLDVNKASVLQAWEAARVALRRDGRSGGLQLAAGSTIRELVAATRNFAAPAAGEAISALVGLGEGSTPAGDNFLVGYFAGLLSSVGVIEARTSLVSVLCEELKAAASRTHRVSRIYLEAGAEGQVSERLYTVAAAIAASAERAVAIATQQALNVGYSSGACGVLGFLIGCTAWSRDDDQISPL
jgi:hypothetical protein